MKYAYYGHAADEPARVQLLAELRADAKGDPAFYSAYIDVPKEYNASFHDLRGWQSLMSAVRRGRIDTVVIPSLEALHMTELRVDSMLARLTEKGVAIAIGEPGCIVAPEALVDRLIEKQIEYLQRAYAAPLITMTRCFYKRSGNTAFACLEPDVLPHYADGAAEPFVDVVRKFADEGFFLYRSDVRGWYYIADYMAEVLLDIFDVGYETLFASMDL